MKEIIKKIAYLKGLCEGISIESANPKESAIFTGILDVLEEIADALDDIGVRSDDEEDDEFDEEYSYAFICPSCGQELEVDEDILDSEEELICTACGNKIPIITEFADFDDEDD